MKVKNVKLEWYVLNYDWNKQEVVDYNIFNSEFIEKLHKEVKKKKITNYDQLKEFIDSYCQYHFRGRREYEIAVGDLGVKNTEDLEKIDIYRQVKCNLNNITKYVDSELKIFKKENK